ncbi:serine/threonine protein phosphatase [Scytonema hofmannii PCC 7110]|uniref:Serine/threonine protein phosphatase n=1 Tax=Scytonema hofmannii PCC 7110 TaxID=128403 RepID=A0A139XE67_9CYAN|nr:serine/threonine phosphatase [Scytonema hofmannii]KYC42994.1 serine/threonine protein phosphatase [Scytonema hofmannii PCC 7110]
MLICPQCNFENPNTNRFCQNCGDSLTHRVCPECSADVALDAQYCDNCGAECGTILWAIVTKEKTEDWELGTVGQEDKEVRGEEDIEDPPPSPSPPLSPSLLPARSYLDGQQRYQILEPSLVLEDIPFNTEVGVRVLDCQPYQRTLLEVILLNDEQGVGTSSLGTGEIPSLASPYIVLQPLCHLGIPPIHDTWQHDGLQVILVEDRSHWQSLLDVWHEETISSLQIVNFFYQMTQLWPVLEKVNCRQSLLKLSNLRLDEDQSLALQQLYIEPVHEYITEVPSEDEIASTGDVKAQPFSVQTLGRMWQALFRESQRTQFGSILHLLGDLELGKVQSLEQLQSRLEAISSELQGLSSTSSSSPTPELPQNTDSRTILQLEEEEDTDSKVDDMPTVVLPMQLMSLDYAGLTDVGRQRDHNEDYFGIETEIYKLELPNNRTLQARGLYVLCDGMGGHAGGEVASALAVSTLRQYFQTHWASNQMPPEGDIRQAVRQANKAIYDVNQKDFRSGVGRMGTTLVMVLVYDTQVAVAHVGDSRLYRVTRKGGLEQITVDHEVGQREISRGVEPSVAYARPDAYQLTQALGPRDDNYIIPDVKFLEINEDTLFILASDGLSDNNLLTLHWQTHLHPLLSSGANLEHGVKALIDLANNYNGHDNITAVVIRAKVRPNMEQQ